MWSSSDARLERPEVDAFGLSFSDLIDRNDFATEGNQRNHHKLEIGHGERNANDRDRQEERCDQMQGGEPPADEDENPCWATSGPPRKWVSGRTRPTRREKLTGPPYSRSPAASRASRSSRKRRMRESLPCLMLTVSNIGSSRRSPPRGVPRCTRSRTKTSSPAGTIPSM
jgi:hypothetical protein